MVAAVIDTLPANLRDQIAHAQMMSDRYAAQFRRITHEQMVKRGLDGGASSNRFRQSLDILIDRKKRCVQEPRYYFFPELSQGQFYDRNDFPWLGMLEAQTVAIRAELLEVMKTRSAFKPYVQSASNRPNQNQQGMLNIPDWSAFYLWKDADIVAQNAARCPHSMRALADGPLTKVARRPPSVLFSSLQPGPSIPPHHGFLNTHLICRLPLIVPDGCGVRVGNEVRTWVKGAPGCSMTPLNTKPETTAWWYG